jgi:hypothetical protein
MIIITQINYLIISYDHSLFTNKQYGQITDLIKTCETNVFAALRQQRIIFFLIFCIYETERTLTEIKESNLNPTKLLINQSNKHLTI